MNLFAMILLAATSIPRFPGATQYLPMEVRRACVDGAATKVALHVVDEEGRPVKDATVGVGFSMNGKKNPGAKGLTDAQGHFEATGWSVGEVIYSVRKDGYYRTRSRIWLAGTLDKAGEVKDGKWQPYGKVYDVILKRKRNPVPMCAYCCTRAIPRQGVDLGFDLRAGDFVKPYGKGLDADFVLRHDKVQDSYWRYRAELTLSFTNALDGVYVRKKDAFSGFTSDYHAATNATYLKTLTFVYDSRDPKAKVELSLGADEYLVMRTRTRVNGCGELVEAFYSRLEGDFKYLRDGVDFAAYVNVEPNSTNLEFDPNANLLKFSPRVWEIRRP